MDKITKGEMEARLFVNKVLKEGKTQRQAYKEVKKPKSTDDHVIDSNASGFVRRPVVQKILKEVKQEIEETSKRALEVRKELLEERDSSGRINPKDIREKVSRDFLDRSLGKPTETTKIDLPDETEFIIRRG